MVSNVSGAEGPGKPHRYEVGGDAAKPERVARGPAPRAPDERFPPPRSSPFASPPDQPRRDGVTAAPVGAPNADIPDEYLARLDATIDANFPPRYLRYPEEVFSGYPPYLKREGELHYVPEVVARYNPFNLTIPYRLQSYETLYDHTRVPLDSSNPWVATRWELGRSLAIRTHLDLVKQYNIAYVTLLRAVNGSGAALAELKTLFTGNKILETAEVRVEFMNTKSTRDDHLQTFVDAMIGLLCVDVLRSSDSQISTAARIRALEILRDDFNLDAIATALTTRGDALGFRLTAGQEVYDLIPRTFVTKREEAGGTPHDDLFWKNEKIKEIFPSKPHPGGLGNIVDLDEGLRELVSKYPREAVQVLLSVVRTQNFQVDQTLAFHALVALTKLDESRKEIVFGSGASYRKRDSANKSFQERMSRALNGVRNANDRTGEH